MHDLTQFRARWRPGIGWVCLIAFAYHFIVQPLLTLLFVTVLTLNGSVVPTFPAFDMESLNTLMFVALGLGGYRTFEKHQKVDSSAEIEPLQ